MLPPACPRSRQRARLKRHGAPRSRRLRALESARGRCSSVLSELWHAEPGYRADLLQVQLPPEGGRRAEVQGNDADDESARRSERRACARRRTARGSRRGRSSASRGGPGASSAAGPGAMSNKLKGTMVGVAPMAGGIGRSTGPGRCAARAQPCAATARHGRGRTERRLLSAGSAAGRESARRHARRGRRGLRRLREVRPPGRRSGSHALWRAAARRVARLRADRSPACVRSASRIRRAPGSAARLALRRAAPERVRGWTAARVRGPAAGLWSTSARVWRAAAGIRAAAAASAAGLRAASRLPTRGTVGLRAAAAGIRTAGDSAAHGAVRPGGRAGPSGRSWARSRRRERRARPVETR